MADISYTIINPPGGVFVDAMSINDSGQIAGYIQDSNGHFDGFLDSHGTYTTIDPPGSIDTFVQSINDSGQITGYYVDGEGQDLGFLYTRGTYTMIDPPGSTETFAQSLNDRGQVVGYYEDSSGRGYRLPLQPRYLHDDRSPRQRLYRPAEHKRLRTDHRMVREQ
jgi:uncharacterized membrane protein